MLRKIIHIDEEKCNGCGACARACHEGAIDMVNGKAKLVRENFCDGFGDCLPNCPAGAITFEEREAPAYDEEAVRKAKEDKAMDDMKHEHPAGGCPGSRMMQFHRDNAENGGFNPGNGGLNPGNGGFAPGNNGFNPEKGGFGQGNGGFNPGNGGFTPENGGFAPVGAGRPVSRLNQWPVQIKLLPTRAPFYDGAKLLIAADCTAYAYAGLHEEFMRGKITMIGCPKLDEGDYTQKLTEIISNNNIKSVTIVRMEVPCCGGLQRAAENALKASGKFIPWQVVTISRDGRILD